MAAKVFSLVVLFGAEGEHCAQEGKKREYNLKQWQKKRTFNSKSLIKASNVGGTK